MGLKKSGIFITLLFCITILSSIVNGLDYKPELNAPRSMDLSLETKRNIRQEMLAHLLVKYTDNQTFPKMHEYMIAKYRQLHKSGNPRLPNQIITETLEKARSLFEKVKPYVGSDFKRKYQPEEIEKTVNKYLWLKGICFLFLGIKDEHKNALSYFYLPGNEEMKYQFLRDTVKFSFPEVYDVPENSAWFDGMASVMERIGYKLFDVNKYCPEAVLNLDKMPGGKTPAPTEAVEKPAETPVSTPDASATPAN